MQSHVDRVARHPERSHEAHRASPRQAATATAFRPGGSGESRTPRARRPPAAQVAADRDAGTTIVNSRLITRSAIMRSRAADPGQALAHDGAPIRPKIAPDAPTVRRPGSHQRASDEARARSCTAPGTDAAEHPSSASRRTADHVEREWIRRCAGAEVTRRHHCRPTRQSEEPAKPASGLPLKSAWGRAEEPERQIRTLIPRACR